MARNFEINIRLMVTSSQDTTAKQHLEGHLRQPALEERERQELPRYDCECTLVTVGAVD